MSQSHQGPPAWGDPSNVPARGESTSPIPVPLDVSQPAVDERDEVCFSTPVHGQTIDEVLIDDRIRRRWLVPLCLFLAACCTTFLAGVYQWRPDFFPLGPELTTWVARNWWDGLIYMLAVIGFLAAHEMGHFLMTVRYGVHSSYPLVIQLPLYIGTMGAVIAMDGRRADRRQMFDIGIAGPLAGLVIAIPVICAGVLQATLIVPPPGTLVSGDPLLAELLIQWLRPDAAPGAEVVSNGNPLYMAGWVGMLVTGLNMMPISQLDGGHIIYALFRQRSHYIARGFLLTAIGYVILSDNYRWTLMIILVTILGTDHPPTSNDNMPLGRGRYLLGLASIAIPVFCFIPNPI